MFALVFESEKYTHTYTHESKITEIIFLCEIIAILTAGILKIFKFILMVIHMVKNNFWVRFKLEAMYHFI